MLVMKGKMIDDSHLKPLAILTHHWHRYRIKVQILKSYWFFSWPQEHMSWREVISPTVRVINTQISLLLSQIRLGRSEDLRNEERRYSVVDHHVRFWEFQQSEKGYVMFWIKSPTSSFNNIIVYIFLDNWINHTLPEHGVPQVFAR